MSTKNFIPEAANTKRQMTSSVGVDTLDPARSLGRCKGTPLAKGSMCPDFHSQLEKIRSDEAFSVPCWCTEYPEWMNGRTLERKANRQRV